jgi:putative tryptophan/tyrosine transport system substrate-binding protein
MKRRDFITLLGGAAAAWSRAARAQQPGKIWRIGFLAHGPVKSYERLFEGLRELGYIEGQNIIVERRYAEGRAERFADFAREMVRLKADVIVVVTTPAALAVMKATKTIPIVHPAAIDPLGAGLIESLAHPGKNLTGASILHAELTAKRLDLLKKMVPKMGRTAVLWNSANPANAGAWGELQAASRALDVALQSHELRESKDVAVAFTSIAQERPDALLVIEDALTFQYRKEIVEFTVQNRLPGSFVGKEAVEAGGLMSYGARLPELYHRAATYVDKILKGAKPSDLPVEEATILELAINLKTANALSLTVPPGVLAIADEVIE